jgi:hypothetical protein
MPMRDKVMLAGLFTLYLAMVTASLLATYRT